MSATEAQRLAIELPRASDRADHITSQDVIDHIEFLEREIRVLRAENQALKAKLGSADLQTGKKTRVE